MKFEKQFLDLVCANFVKYQNVVPKRSEEYNYHYLIHDHGKAGVIIAVLICSHRTSEAS